MRHYSWLAPHEPLGPHDGSGWPDGGFAYLWDEVVRVRLRVTVTVRV